LQHESQPIAAFTLAPHAPKVVAEAYAVFDSIAEEYGGLLGEIADQAELAAVDSAKARSEAAAARIAGEKSARDPAKVEAEHAAKAAELASGLNVLKLAVDRSGNDLADACAAAREDWISELGVAREKATARLAKALATARQALEDLRPLVGAEQWVAEFNPVMARAGRQSPYGGGALTLDASLAAREFSSYTEPARLLDLLEELVSPTPKYVGTTDGRPVYVSTVRGRLVRHFEDGTPEEATFAEATS
jgi:hypothetical protein